MAPDDLPQRGEPAAPDTAPQGPRQTLAMRLAERNRQRELRAERLARLRPPSGPTPGSMPGPEAAPAPAAPPDPAEDAEAALEEFLRALAGNLPVLPAGPPVAPGELLPFRRPVEAAARTPGDLDRLPGVGPGLTRALERAGLCCLADLAGLEPAELAARLGPVGRLVPAERWVAAARDAAVPPPDPAP